jgi:hypothetical protein
MSKESWLRILQLFYQGLNLIAAGLKKEIESLKAERPSE